MRQLWNTGENLMEEVFTTSRKGIKRIPVNKYHIASGMIIIKITDKNNLLERNIKLPIYR